MAKITITIEDDGDAVKVVSDPTFGEIMGVIASKGGPTAAETYATSALRHVLEMSKAASKGVVEVQVPMSNPPKGLKLVGKRSGVVSAPEA